MNQTAVEYLAEKLLENQTYDRNGYVIIDISVEHFEYLVERAKQIEQLNLKLENVVMFMNTDNSGIESIKITDNPDCGVKGITFKSEQ